MLLYCQIDGKVQIWKQYSFFMVTFNNNTLFKNLNFSTKGIIASCCLGTAGYVETCPGIQLFHSTDINFLKFYGKVKYDILHLLVDQIVKFLKEFYYILLYRNFRVNRLIRQILKHSFQSSFDLRCSLEWYLEKNSAICIFSYRKLQRCNF